MDWLCNDSDQSMLSDIALKSDKPVRDSQVSLRITKLYSYLSVLYSVVSYLKSFIPSAVIIYTDEEWFLSRIQYVALYNELYFVDVSVEFLKDF